MSKVQLPLTVGDISTFAKTLRSQIDDLERTPSHVEMLNLLAKAAGFRNFQHFRAQHDVSEPTTTPPQPIVEVNPKRLKQLVRYFDSEGTLIRWPGKYTQRGTCLWVMWSRIPAKVLMTENEINDRLEAQHQFGDYALLRRELVDRGMLGRTADGRQYKRVELEPPAEALELFKRLRSSI
ncbi:MAG: DUF2087 domain-containing protein [Pseudodesulfovibrio sp.]